MRDYKGLCKKILCLLVAAVITISVVEPALAATKGYYFSYNKAKATPGQSAAAFLKAAGEADSVKKTNSCATKGYDYTYEYKGFTIVTYTNTKKKNAKEYVSSIKITSSDVKTAEGITIGTKESTVKKKYKNAKKKFGVYSHKKGKTIINITVEKKKVTAIEIIKA